MHTQLKRKYRLQRVISFTEHTKELMWHVGTLIFSLAVFSYFLAHWLLWLTGYYDTINAIMIIK